MVKKKYIAPNLITAGNLFLGYLSITESIKGKYDIAILFIILAMICDGLDGKAARKLDAFSEFGKEFDSFCDAISFGLAPSMLVYSILEMTIPNGVFNLPVSFIYALCGVMRLVKFNIINVASSEKGDFSGMPIPNAAAMVISYYMICSTTQKYFGVNLFDVNIFIGITIISASLMVSIIPFKTPDKTFSFVPKKFAPFLIFVIIFTLKYSMFVVSYTYVILNLISYFNKRFMSEHSAEDIKVEEFIEITEEE